MTTTHPDAVDAPAAPPAPRLPRGTRGTVSVGELHTETGGHLPDVELAYETWGTLDEDGSNAVLVLHALTGDAHVASHDQDPSAGWWEELVGPGRAVDTDRWFVVSPNMVGGCDGSTGPSSPAPDGAPWGGRFPFLTLRDAVETERRLAEHLGVTAWQAVIGGSMGGARAIEWAVTHPDMVRGVAVLASTACSSAEQIAWAQAQTQAVRLDPDWAGGDYHPGPGPVRGLGIARRIAHTTYRSAAELQHRFGRAAQGSEDPFGTVAGPRAGRYQVESYLDHQAAKLVDRFDAGSYVTLTEALMSHDVGRGRGGVEAALARFRGRAFVAAVDSDRLYFPAESHRLAELLPGEVPVHTIASPIGHDGFLTEYGQVAEALQSTLAL
ncbi:homoserine O-acetyltransferase [Micrococcus sp.]|uniref:homoserine O-acetyltransferase MetX n=1 Tax=Micrococcus sp. TaxID=1271 RepID=UPI0026DCA37B|nr:homoserine O-acetyltransferase [Micrococcus sp.]MDO4239075.1 homoserine O-acetyltransferase [Micrococcus sp.]